MSAATRWREHCHEMAGGAADEDVAGAWRVVAGWPGRMLAYVPIDAAIREQWSVDAVISTAMRRVADGTPAPRPTRGEGKATLALRAAVHDVLNDIDGPMSGRQVFYQCVSRGFIANNKASCNRVLRLLVKMRRDGSVPYERIVDRTRAKHVRPSWAGVEDILNACAGQFRSDYWNTRPVVPMVACEKQALEGIFADAVDTYGVQLWIIRGYSSESFDYEWSESIKSITSTGRRVAIYYFGDFDPSGVNIEANSKKKLEGFGAKFDWERAGLLFDDLDRFDLVRVPVKRTDSRAKSFLSQFGDNAAELDALRPDELRRRIHSSIERHVAAGSWLALKRADAAERESLRMVAGNWDLAIQAVRGAV